MTSLMISDEKAVSVVAAPLKFHVEVADFICCQDEASKPFSLQGTIP